MTADEAAQAAWDEHVAWSEAATLLKRRRTIWRRVALALTIAGAALQTLAGMSGDERVRFWAGLAGTIALAVVAFAAKWCLSPESTRNWLRARSISEGIKSEVFAFRAGASPYETEEAVPLFVAKWRAIRDLGKDLQLIRAAVAPPRKEVPPRLDSAAYLERRVAEQINRYYRPKAKENADKASQARNAEFWLALLATILGAVATFSKTESIGPWVAVLTTIGATIATYAAASRYEFQATTFYATARQLDDLRVDWLAAGKTAPSPEWSEFVRECEEAISAENRSWMAKLDEAQTDHKV